MRILIFILTFISFTASAQISPRQIKGAIPPEGCHVLLTDTLTGLAMWQECDSVFTSGGGRLDTAYVDEDGSLVIISTEGDTTSFDGVGGNDSTFLEVTTDDIPNHLDSAYRKGYTLFEGLNGGLISMIELLKEGEIQFDNEVGLTDKYLIRFKPLQQDEGNSDFLFGVATTPQSIDRNNDVFMMGWNMNPGGVLAVSGDPAFGISLENHYRFSGRNYNEFHLIQTDALGVNRRPITFFIDKSDPLLWTGAYHIVSEELRHPLTENPYVRFYMQDTTAAGFRLLGSKSGDGLEIFADPPNNNVQMLGYGMTNPALYTSNFYETKVNRLTIENMYTGFGDATSILGWRSDNKVVNNITAGWGIDLTGGVLLADSSQVATQYDLTLITSDDDQELSIDSSGASAPRTITIGIEDGNDVTFMDLGGDADGNGLFDAANEGGTIAVELVEVPNDGLFWQSVTNASNFWGYTPAQGTLSNISVAGDDLLELNNGHATYGSWIALFSDVNFDIGISKSADQFQIRQGSVEPFVIQGTPTVDNSLLIQNDGDVQISDYPNSRDDGTPTNILGTDASGVIQSYPVADVGGTDTDNQNLTIEGSGPTYTVAIDDGTDVIIAGAGGITLSESPANTLVITQGAEVDGSITNEAWTIDGDAGDTEVISNQTVLFDGTGIVSTTYTASSNTLEINAVEVDGSTTNELNTIEEGNSSVQTGNLTIDFQSMFDVATDGGTEVNVSLDAGEFTTVTNWEVDDYTLWWDDDGVHQKMLVEDFVQEILDLVPPGGADADWFEVSSTDPPDAITDDIYHTGDVIIGENIGPDAKLHVKTTPTGVVNEMIVEALGETVEIQTKAVSGSTQPPHTMTFNNKDTHIDISGDYYKMAQMQVTKASATLPGGSMSFSIGYDSVNMDQVLTVNSRATGATDGYVGIVGGLRYKWAATASTTITLNLGDYGITSTAAGTKTYILPDAVAGIVGQFYMIYNNGAGIGTVTAPGSGDAIKGDPQVFLDESIQVHCPAANVWVITN